VASSGLDSQAMIRMRAPKLRKSLRAALKPRYLHYGILRLNRNGCFCPLANPSHRRRPLPSDAVGSVYAERGDALGAAAP
jgi:hypothetical protein